VRGIQIVKPRNGSLQFVIKGPMHKRSNGVWREAVELPDIVLKAVATQLCETMAGGRHRSRGLRPT
jgi:hypothetical protein